MENEALTRTRVKIASKMREQISFHEKERQYDAATKIQSVARGNRDREKFVKLSAEKRVMNALRNLLTELSRPELRDNVNSNVTSVLQVDSSILKSLSVIGGAHDSTKSVKKSSIKSSTKNDVTKNDKKIVASPSSITATLKSPPKNVQTTNYSAGNLTVLNSLTPSPATPLSKSESISLSKLSYSKSPSSYSKSPFSFSKSQFPIQNHNFPFQNHHSPI